MEILKIFICTTTMFFFTDFAINILEGIIKASTVMLYMKGKK